jgi:hypothetical protein
MVAGGLLAVVYVLVRRTRPDAVFANCMWIISAWRQNREGCSQRTRNFALPPVQLLHRMPYGTAILAGIILAGGVWLWHA